MDHEDEGSTERKGELMEIIGRAIGLTKDCISGSFRITFETPEDIAEEFTYLSQQKQVRVKATRYTRDRSLDANKMLWACLGDMAKVLHTDKWSLYLKMLKRYGKFTYIVVKPSAVDAMKKQWRESEIVGTVQVGDQKAIQMLCYFGSSTYDTAEFSTLLDGVISEMREMGITPPPSEDIKHSLELWEAMGGR